MVDNETPDSQASRLPKHKVTAIGRLKTFGNTFKRRNFPPPVVFPPPSWDLDDEIIHRSRSNHLNTSSSLVDSDHPPPPPDLQEQVRFAKNLQSLIESATKDQSATRTLEASSDTGLSREPVPPGLDVNLVRMLASEDVMNGRENSTAIQGRKKRDSIWNILAGLKKDNATGRTTVEDEEDGLMMYTPLEPQADSEVKLAEPLSETVADSVVQPESSSSTRSQQPKKTVEKRVPSTTELSVLTAWWGYRIYIPPPVMAKLDNKAIKATTRAAMVATALKWLLEKIPIAIVPVQFRPAVTLLKRLSPLTGYIGIFIAWSWDRVRSLDEGTVHKLYNELAYLIHFFNSQGNGVVLTATWLLPVALLPMAWNAGDIYRPILPPSPEELKKMVEAAAKAAEEERKAAEKAKRTTSLAQEGQEGRKKSWFRW